MENLATIQKVKNVRHHPNADALDIVQVLGWQVVTKRDEFKENDLAVYIVIDTVLPETNPMFEFLRNKNFRIKPIRLRGEESAGICFPLSILDGLKWNTLEGDASLRPEMWVGMDVTNVLDIKHYEKPIPAELAGKAIGGLPGFIIMTDEDNLRSYPDAVPEMYGRPYYITRKDDGQSGTFFLHDGTFGVCSRKIHLMETEGNGFWRMARKYKIEEALRASGTDIAIQGEVCGPGIQDNHLGLTELELHVFNLFNIVTRSYLPYEKLVEFCKVFNMPMVTTIEEGNAFGYTLEELIKLAGEQKYLNGTPAEGIVIRPKESFTSDKLKSRKAWSGKVLNPLFEEEKKKKK
jgi:RNA ligase (TIGR02306 family)